MYVYGMSLCMWLENQRMEAEKRAEEYERLIVSGQTTIDNIVQLSVWQARESAFREVMREMGYETVRRL